MIDDVDTNQDWNLCSLRVGVTQRSYHHMRVMSYYFHYATPEHYQEIVGLLWAFKDRYRVPKVPTTPQPQNLQPDEFIQVFTEYFLTSFLKLASHLPVPQIFSSLKVF